MKPVKAKCEVCEHVFRVQMLVARLSNRVDKHYFICPSCKTEFVSYYSNREMRQLQKEISKLYNGFRKCYSKEQAEVIQAKIDKKDLEFKWLRDKLRTEIENNLPK
ncbi:transglycosylase [Bacillus cereus]|uniref:transglycosylase n=1 Tax=Bacillus cereus TaxID=1396 RepID=UPI000BF29CB9|nr:transglycosylase [Bacillus cereus]PFD09182.1 transglycosylase [Bacillus cereus]HDX9649065.1 transglycosylase [Bacillus cereus]